MAQFTPLETFCKGCGVAFKDEDHGPVHDNGSCWARWEYACLLAVEEAAADLFHALTTGGLGSCCMADTDQLQESLSALQDCRDAQV